MPRLLGDNLISDTIKPRLHQSWWGNSQSIKGTSDEGMVWLHWVNGGKKKRDETCKVELKTWRKKAYNRHLAFEYGQYWHPCVGMTDWLSWRCHHNAVSWLVTLVTEADFYITGSQYFQPVLSRSSSCSTALPHRTTRSLFTGLKRSFIPISEH